jgi:hypothetical protein
MSAPSNVGSRLYALAQHVVDEQTLRQVIEPTLADLQHELHHASGGRLARTRALLSGYVAFWKVLFLQFLAVRPPMDVRIIVRMAGIAVLALFGYVLALRVLPFALLSIFPPTSRSAWEYYVAVQGLVSMMPFAVFAAVLWSARGPSLQERPNRIRACALLTMAASLAACAVTMWALPPLVSALDQARHGTTVQAPWGVAILSWIRSAAECVAFAMLGVGLAPYARRIAVFVLALALIPFLSVFLGNALAVYAGRFWHRSPAALALVVLMPYVLVFCSGLWMIAWRRHVRQASA